MFGSHFPYFICKIFHDYQAVFAYNLMANFCSIYKQPLFGHFLLILMARTFAQKFLGKFFAGKINLRDPFLEFK